MTIRFGPSLITGSTVFGVDSLGILGFAIPSTGTDGPSILYDDLNLPSENGNAFRALIITPPVGLTSFVMGEDGSIVANGPNGNYTGTYQGFKDGVSYGFSTFSFTLGNPVAGILRDMNQSFSGKRLCTTPQVGVIASSIPTTGTDGPPYAYNDLSLPGDANKLVRGFITAFPTAGTLTAYDDTSFTFSGAPDGSYSFTYELRLDDVVQGTATAYLTVGVISAAVITTTLDNETTSLSSTGSTASSAVVTVVLDDETTSVSLTGYSGSGTAALALTLDDDIPSVYAVSTFASAGTTTLLDNELLNISAFVPAIPPGTTSFSITLDDELQYITAYGSNPPTGWGPQPILPITLALTLDGKLLIVV